MSNSPPQFDAIVVGSGITGGWAAKELTENGLKVLMLDRGRMVEHGKDYTGEHMPPWEQPYGGMPLRDLYAREYPIQSRSYAFDETTRHFWNNDRDNPYIHTPGEFNWMRADVVGGRSLLWGRQVYRWSDIDFQANKRDGYGVDWPLRYREIEPWYDHVERFIGVSGQEEGLEHLPDSRFLPPMDMTVVEKAVKERLQCRYKDRMITIGRSAVLTQPHQGRSPCHYCGPCERGCSAGAYFSTQSSTLPAAQQTGNLTLLADSVVASVVYDPKTRKAKGVRVIDTKTREKSVYTGKLIFLCASTIGSTQILLNSRCSEFPTGLANRSGTLGHYLMDHIVGAGAFGIMPGFEDKGTFGKRPNGVYLPRFRNLDVEDQAVNFVRGYGYQGNSMRLDWSSMARQIPGFGADFKHALRRPGPWLMYLTGFGECLPQHGNRMETDATVKDRFGIPQVRFHFRFGDNENNMRQDMVRQAEEMLVEAGLIHVTPISTPSTGGDAIHEMGTARMGHSPEDSVLNRWNQSHDVANLFVTDGACMTSSSCVNPSLTYMALTARAADYAAKRLRAGDI